MNFREFTFNPFVLLTFSLVLVLIVSQLIQDGMFMDGSLYVCVSHNLSQGIGTFWEPNYSKTSMVIFREQPPLYFGLMSIFFKVFGSSMYVERFFGFCCLVVELFLMVCLWRSVIKEHTGARHSWLPILFFIIIPVVFWSYANLVEETVMVIFATMAVLFLRYAIQEKEKMKQFALIVLAAIAIFLSTLTKGIQGSFPLVAVIIFWLFERKISFKKSILLSIVLIICFSGIYLMLFLIDDTIYLNLKLYLENRLSKAFVTNVHKTTDSHFYLLYRLISELIPLFVILFLMIIFVYKKQKNHKLSNTYLKTVNSFIFIGLSGTLPLMLTREQRGFYLLTALPFFALTLALVSYPYISFQITLWKKKIRLFTLFRLAAILMLLGSVIFTLLQINEYKRDKALLHDVYLFLPLLPKGSIVKLSDDLMDNWSIQNYLVRYKYISSDFFDRNTKYLIKSKKYDFAFPLNNYQKIDLKTELFDLYIKLK
jgi:hypothetical protein